MTSQSDPLYPAKGPTPSATSGELPAQGALPGNEIKFEFLQIPATSWSDGVRMPSGIWLLPPAGQFTVRCFSVVTGPACTDT
ncbi:MAG: hypothetical protein JWO93_3001 [Micrococcaceae bacterium]|nr:hypothetical protein [Micrococcaceae bacterium]